MDVARYRSNSHRLIRLPGFSSLVPIRALTRAELFAVDDEIAQRFGSHRHTARAVAVQLAVVRAATDLADCESLTPQQLAAIFDAWDDVQSEHMPDTTVLRAEAELQLIEKHGFLVGDANAAGHSEGPGDFYGVPVGELTDGQLAYFLALREAHTRWSEKRCRTVQALRRIAKRSATTNRSADGR